MSEGERGDDSTDCTSLTDRYVLSGFIMISLLIVLVERLEKRREGKKISGPKCNTP